jgi:hypothetical protein
MINKYGALTGGKEAITNNRECNFKKHKFLQWE